MVAVAANHEDTRRLFFRHVKIADFLSRVALLAAFKIVETLVDFLFGLDNLSG